MKKHALILISMLILTAPLFAQDSGKISGYMFGDYYYMAANHNEDLEGANGFWMRRIYFAFDKGLSEAFSMRLRLEMSSAGNFTGKDKMTPVVKDAYLKWKKGKHSIYLGISGTPTWGLVEKFWGYRSVEKTALDLQKLGSSRDFGIGVKGTLDSNKRVKYHLLLGNGSSNGTENNEGKKAMFSVSAKTEAGFIIEGYVDFEERPGETNRYTLQGFAGYDKKTFRVGVQFAHQNRQVAGADDMTLQVGSLFAVAKLSEKVWGFARIDRMFDPNPSGAKISYIPFDASAKSTFFVGGLDFQPAKNIHLMPNIEAVFYSENDAGVSPDSDIIPRFSFYYKF
ncbi:MAG: hypothetical protein ACE5IY_08325 [bacterium]